MAAVLDNKPGVTVFLIFEANAGNNETLLEFNDGAGTVIMLEHRTGSALLRATIDPGTGTTTTLDGPTSPAAPALIDFRAGAGPAASLRVDGVEAASDVATTISLGPHTDFIVMDRDGGSRNADGVVGRILILPFSAPDVLRQSIADFLTDRWL